MAPPVTEGPKGTYRFVRYVRVILPIDGFAFWIRADRVSQSALYNAGVLNRTQLNQSPTLNPPVVVMAKGSLHYSTEVRQDEEEVISVNRVVFNAEQEVQDLNLVNPNVIFIGNFEGVRYAFSSRESWFQQAGIYHYAGSAIYSDMVTQVVDDPRQLDLVNAVVSNSLPIWLSLNGYQGQFPQSFGNTITLYPSLLTPLNLAPPFGVVHVVPGETRALQAAPLIASDGSHWQLTRDLVRVTLYGARNFSALTFQDCVNQFSLDTDLMGVMNMPVMRDEKRSQAELLTIAQKKSVEYEVSYYQATARSVARQLIQSALPIDYEIVAA